MDRRRRWSSSVLLITIIILELVEATWSYESIYGSRMNNDYAIMQQAWKLRGRRGRGNNQGRGHHGGGGGGGGGAAAGGGQRRNRLMWDRDDLRPNKFRQNKRLSTPHASQDDFISVESCCPTIYEIVEPLAGKNRTGHLVDLYRDEKVRQRFYEVSCNPSVVNKACRFLENRHSRFSTCIQQFSFTYALVRPTDHALPNPDQPWYLDYISIRSGCACQVVSSRRRKKQRAEF